MRPIIFGVLLLIALAAFFYTISRFVRFLGKGRKVTRTFDEKGARFGDLILYFLFQRSVAREPASLHHLLIFWGFLIICCGSLELMVQGFYPPFSYAMIVGQTLDHLFKLVLDLTNAVVLVIMLYSYFRRIVLRPPLIPLSGDAALILGMISLLCITHFIMHGAHLVATGAAVSHGYMPVSAATAGLLGKLAPATAATVAEANYWVHMLIILFFLNYIPYSKHIHLIGAFFNIALRNRGQKGVLPKLDLEDESQWGVSRYEQFDWKSLLDLCACTECARCSNNCPAHTTGKPLSPMHLIHDLRDEMKCRGDKLIRLTPGIDPNATDEAEGGEEGKSNGKPKPNEADKQLLKELSEAKPMVGGRIEDEVLWSCTTCGACEGVCPVFIEHPLKIMQMRTHLVLAESRMPKELARMFKGMENNSNPWGIGSDQRMDWAEGLDVPIMEEKKKAEYLVWIGCAGAYDDRAKKLSRVWVELLKHAGVDFAVLGLEEGCTGDAARRAGNEFLFQTLAEMNIEAFKKYDVKKILVTCPHCYHSFKNEYPQFGVSYEVYHHTEFLKKLLDEGKLRPSKTLDSAMVYHDSCYLGRWNEIYQQPRQVLEALGGGRALLEMDRTGDKSFCCGAGGARMWMEEAAPRVNVVRTEEALKTGAKTIATACPFCMVMLTDGVKAKDKEEEVRVFDIAELVQQCCMPELGKTAEEAKVPPPASEPPKTENPNLTT